MLNLTRRKSFTVGQETSQFEVRPLEEEFLGAGQFGSCKTGVVPNAINLREKLCLYYPLWFLI